MAIFLWMLTAITVCLAGMEVLYVYKQSPTRESKLLQLVCFCNLIQATGNMEAVIGQTSEACYTGLIITYFGGSHVALFFLLLMCEIVHVNLPKWFITLSTAIDVIFIGLAVFEDKLHFYYRSISYDTSGLISSRTVDFAPGFYVYLGFLVSYFIVILAIIIKARARNATEFARVFKAVRGFMFAAFFSYGGSLVSTIFKLRYDFTAAGLSIGLLLLILLVYKYRVYPMRQDAEDTILNQINDVLLSYDKDGHLIYCNKRAQDVLHIETEFMYGMPVDDVSDDLSRVLMLAPEEQITLDNHIYSCSLFKFDTEDGGTGIIRWLRDITLEQSQVNEMIRLKEEADHANEAKSVFLARMSHEIRTPINAIIGMDELILREAQEESIKNYGVNIMRAGKTLLSLISDVLDFSKMEAGKMSIVEDEYSLSAMLRDLSLMIRMRAEKKGLTYHLNAPQDLPEKLFGDELRVRQIITNVLTNAVKYTQSGSIMMSVEALPTGSDKIEMLVSIKDTGVGIKEEDIPKLFTSFDRIENAETHKTEGSGLGLNITDNLIRLMGGRMTVKSKYGEGSEFILIIPQHVHGTETVGVISDQISESEMNRDKNRIKFRAPEAHILVVDDNRVNRTLSKAFLKGTDILVDEADCGQKCLDMIRDTAYDLILMDHRMPGLSGVETLQMMRMNTDHKCVGVPVIIMTADVGEDRQSYFLRMGFAAYIGKPMNAVEYENLVRTYLPQERVILL